MNRGYTRDDYLDKVQRLKKVCPDIRLTSDIIVGFPGETDEQFEQTLTLMEEVRFADVFSFLYSRREGTAAADLEESLPPQRKQERFDRLLTLQQAISTRIWQQDVGQTLPVLVEGESRQKGELFGRTTWNRIVHFEADTSLIGRLVPVRVIASMKNSQRGELPASAEPMRQTG
jgi:tRNA-2-methylthio-N6-dimethylallyladenosine synthase